jgi:hypothetical protein
VITDFLAGNGPNLSWALLSVLLARQSITKATSSFKKATRMFRDKNTTDALFRTGAPIVKPLGFGGQEFKQFGRSARWSEALREVVTRTFFEKGEIDIQTLNWSPSSTGKILDVQVAFSVNEMREECLVRFFSNSIKLEALRERLILNSDFVNLPAPRLISSGNWNGLEYNVLDVQDTNGPLMHWQEVANLLRETLTTLSIPEYFREQYDRSTPSFLDHITDDALSLVAQLGKPLGINLTDAEAKEISHQAREMLTLPVSLVNHSIEKNAIRIDPGGRATLLHWGKWGIEPFGTHLSASSRTTENIERLLKSAVGSFQKPTSAMVKASLLTWEYRMLAEKLRIGDLPRAASIASLIAHRKPASGGATDQESFRSPDWSL